MLLQIMAPFLYKTNEAPRFIRGHSVTMAMVAMAGAIYAFMMVYFKRVNSERDRGKYDGKADGLGEEEILELGEHNPKYRYTY
jgi:hypothetical protein